MRRLWVVFVLLLGGLFAAQATLAASTAYRGCCLDDCKSLHCIGAGCTLCAAQPAVAPPLADRPSAQAVQRGVRWANVAKPAPVADIWSPPD